MTRPCVSVWSSVAPSSRSIAAGGDDDFQAADVGSCVGTHLVGERRLRDDVEAEVVFEVLARIADDLEPQTEAIAFGLGVAQRDESAATPRG